MKVLIADDHALVREGMRHVLVQLADNVEIAEASNCEEALWAIESQTGFSLAILDLQMPGDGFVALDAISRQHAALPVVVLSSSQDRNDMRRALEAGAMGFIPKSATAAVMLGALKLVLAGGVYVPPALIARTDPDSTSITPRQFDVLARIVEGKPNKIIADELGLTEATVKSHVTAVFRSLNVTNRTQAVLAAERLGLYMGA